MLGPKVDLVTVAFFQVQQDLPADAPLYDGGRLMPCVVVGDEAFPLMKHLMKPYPALPRVATASVRRFRNPFYGDIHLAALILARGGSKSIPLKNISLVGNRTLLERSLEAIKQTDGFSSVWVSTDHPKISEIAIRNNVNVHINSDANVQDTSTSIAAVQHFLTHHNNVDIVGLVQCTSPFVSSSYLSDAVNAVKSGIECAFSVTRSTKLRWKKVGRNIVALNFHPKFRPRRQNITNEYTENGMFYFATRRLLRKGYFQSRR
ncbi:Cytidylyltransferase [Popillia japonica]|uniref:Cytidylyltransferase n=1 Tax=Popillia japonica TaxID=7064 RepID=A0AAW1HXE9_POPJA